MVLKKSKGSFAATGNTVRKLPKNLLQSGVKTALIGKKTGNFGAVQRDELFDVGPTWYGEAKLSLNKKNRWMISEMLEERSIACTSKLNIEELSDESETQKRKKGKKNKKKKKEREETEMKKTKVVEKNWLACDNQYATVYETTGDEQFVKRGKSWRSARDVGNDNDYDAVYEIVSGFPSQTWPYNVISQVHGDILFHKKNKSHGSMSRKNLVKDDILAETESFIAEVDGFEEDWVGSEDEKQTVPDLAEVQTLHTLGDFVIKTKPKQKYSKLAKKKVNQQKEGTIENEEQGKDRELIYIEKEESDHEVATVSNEYRPNDENEDQPRPMMEQTSRTKYISESMPINGFIDMEIITDSCSVTKHRLTQLYGKRFFEGKSKPRKFGIILDSCFEGGQRLKGKKCIVIAEQIKIDTLRNETQLYLKLVGNETAVIGLANAIQKSGTKFFEDLATEMKRVQRLTISSRAESGMPRVPQHLRNLTNWNPECWLVEEAFDLLAEDVLLKGGDEEKDTKDNGKFIHDAEVVSYHCGICFQGLQDLSGDGTMMQLANCLHSFCRDCWVSYLRQKTKEQAHLIRCPEFRCKTEVDMVTQLSVLEPGMIELSLKNKFEQFLGKSDNWQWCQRCGRLAHCPEYQEKEPKSKICDIPVLQCICSKTWCFKCQENQHWPAKCEDIKTFKRITQKEIGNIFDQYGNIYETNVYVKTCPSCRSPIDKNGGCPYMACRCGNSFCWTCGKKNCTRATCKLTESQNIIFTSIDSLGKTNQQKATKKALKFCYFKKELTKSKVKLGLDRQSTSLDKKHPETSLMTTIKTLITEHANLCTTVENIAMSGLSKSKYYKGRLYRFLDSMELMFNNLAITLKQDHVTKVDMKQVNHISYQLKAKLARFTAFELGMKVKNT